MFQRRHMNLNQIAVVLLFFLSIRKVEANGRAPASTDVQLFAGQTQKILLASTFGALISDDNGNTFQWICEEAIGYGGTFDPVFKAAANGDIYATTWQGLRVSKDGGCTFETAEVFGGGNPGTRLENVFISDFHLGQNGMFWAVSATAGESNDVYMSNDGNVFRSANLVAENAWYRTIKVAPSDDNRIYVSKFVLAAGIENSKAFLMRSLDGGSTWQELALDEIEFGGQATFDVLAVSNTDPNVIYARSEFALAPAGDIIYRSDDGGDSFVEIARFPNGPVNAFQIRQDGSVIMGTASRCLEDSVDDDTERKGCVVTSMDGSVGSFTSTVAQPQMACVNEHPTNGRLYACGSNFSDDEFALGVSDDGGATWDAVARFENIVGPLNCPGNPIQEKCATEDWPTVCETIGLCEQEPMVPEIALPPETDGCSYSGSRNLGWYGLLLLGLWGISRRRVQ